MTDSASESWEIPVSDARERLAEANDAQVQALSQEFAERHRGLLDRLAN